MRFGMITSNRNLVKKHKLCYMNTDSLIAYIKTYDIYIEIAEDVEIRFDTSNDELDRSLINGEN